MSLMFYKRINYFQSINAWSLPLCSISSSYFWFSMIKTLSSWRSFFKIKLEQMMRTNLVIIIALAKTIYTVIVSFNPLFLSNSLIDLVKDRNVKIT